MLNVLVLAELLQAFCFVATISYLRRQLKKACVDFDTHRICQLSDYSVRIDNLPSNTTVPELVNFFNGLYPLDTKDYKGRLPVSGAQEVHLIDNTGRILYKYLSHYLYTWHL